MPLTQELNALFSAMHATQVSLYGNRKTISCICVLIAKAVILVAAITFMAYDVVLTIDKEVRLYRNDPHSTSCSSPIQIEYVWKSASPSFPGPGESQ